MQAAYKNPATKPWYKHRWPWFIMLGPAAVMIATAITVWLAVQQPDAMVVDDYYKQGKAINQDLRRDRVASAMQLALDARFDAQLGNLSGRLSSFGRPMLAPFRIHLAHPTQPHKDLALDALPDDYGNFSVQVAGLEPTHWQVLVEGEGREWRLARSWSPGKQPALQIVADTP